jgi:hypothetical protein
MNKYDLVAETCKWISYGAENYLDDLDDSNGENAYLEELMTAFESVQKLGEYADESLIIEKQQLDYDSLIAWNIWWNNEEWYVFAQVTDEDTYHFEVHEEGEDGAEAIATKFAPHILKAEIQNGKLNDSEWGWYSIENDIKPKIYALGNYRDDNMIIEITDDEAVLYYKDDSKAIRITINDDENIYDIIYFSDVDLLKEILAKFEEK